MCISWTIKCLILLMHSATMQKNEVNLSSQVTASWSRSIFLRVISYEQLQKISTAGTNFHFISLALFNEFPIKEVWRDEHRAWLGELAGHNYATELQLFTETLPQRNSDIIFSQVFHTPQPACSPNRKLYFIRSPHTE